MWGFPRHDTQIFPPPPPPQNSKPQDRLFLLKLDKEIEVFLGDESRTQLVFPPMTAYHRMAVHKMAECFGLAHGVNQSGKSVVVMKTPESKMYVLKSARVCAAIGF